MRNALGLTVCPDCAAVVNDDKTMVHAGTCPLGRHIDKTTAADAAWFDARPGATVRRRPIVWSEAWTVRASCGLPDELEVLGQVVIRQVSPGVRLRSFHEVYALAPEGGGTR